MAKHTLNDLLGTDPAEGHGADSAEQPIDEVEVKAPRPTFQANKTFDASETMTPRLVLAQGMSPEVRAGTAKPGEFLLLGHEPTAEVSLVLAGHSSQRRYVPQGETKAQCYSPDGEQGYGNPGIACAECPLSKWTDSGKKDGNGRAINTPPPCSEIDAFAAFSITHGMPVVWPLKGTAAKAARFIKTLSNGLGMGNFAVKVKSEGKEGKGRAWHEPIVMIDNDVTPEQANIYRDIALGAVQIAGELPAEAS